MRFVRTKDVLMMLGVSRTTLWRMVREGRFPRPTLIAKRAAGHVLEEVEAWMSARVPDQQFIDGYVKAARIFGVEYTPIVNGIASLFQGGAAFPGNDWTMFPGGEDYLSRVHDVVSFDCR